MSTDQPEFKPSTLADWQKAAQEASEKVAELFSANAETA